MKDRIYVDGMYAKKPSQKAPDFVGPGVSLNLEQFMPWLRQWCKDNPDEKWVNISLLEQKADPAKYSAVLDTWKPEKKEEPKAREVATYDVDDTIPF